MTPLIQDIFYISVSIIFCIGVYHVFVSPSQIEKNTIEIEYEKLLDEAIRIGTLGQYVEFIRNWQIFNDRYFDKKGYFDMAQSIHEIIKIKRAELNITPNDQSTNT